MRSGVPRRAATGAAARSGSWTFLSNHGHVLVCLARDPDVRLRDIADAVGITERAVQKIVTDLEVGGIVVRERHGRRNRYRLHPESPLRHPVESPRTVADLLAMVIGAKPGRPGAAKPR